MIEQKDIFDKWQKANLKVAIARVVRTWRSSPRPTGSALLVNENGEMIGSVSGGCVEKAVVSKALKVIESGQSELVKYGVADEDAWEVGLSCGGALTVFISPFFNRDDWNLIDGAINNNKGLIVLTKLNADAEHVIIDPNAANELNHHLSGAVHNAYLKAENELIDDEGISYFCQVFPPLNRMILIGSAHITVEMIDLAQKFGFETIVIDPRDTFATKTAYAKAPDQLHVKWPQEILKDFRLDHNSYAVILSHDPKIDDEALKILLPSSIRYIGALGSKKTHAKRVDRLKNYGFTDQEIEKIHAPIGVPIKALLPKEIALSVMAEVIKAKNSPMS